MQPENNQNPDTNPNPAEAQSQAPEVTSAPVTAVPPVPLTPQPVDNDSKKLLKRGKLAAIMIGAVVLLGGGSAAAYFGVVVPNKPENVLKKAIQNTAKEKQSTFKGSVNFESTEKESNYAGAVTFDGGINTEAKAMQTKLDVTVSGVKVSAELRYVDKKAYIKLGDLATIKSLVSGFAPEAASIVDEVNGKVANQWIEFDETLLKTAKADCALNIDFALTDNDYKILEEQYAKHPFVKTQSTADEKVNGASAIKYELEIDDNASAEFGKGLGELSFVKKLNECDGTKATDTKDLADGDKTPLTLWVDKSSKRIVRVASHSTKQDEEKEHFKANLDIAFKYEKVNVSKPDNAKPFMQLVGELGPTFQGLLGATSGDVQGSLMQDLQTN